MRGSTKKKIEKFVDNLILNSTDEERNGKSKDQLINEVKVFWIKKGKEGQQFIDKVVKGEL